jgi:hypothetical protein
MGPKVAACLSFVAGGGVAVIGSLTEVVPALAGRAGTRIVPNAKRASRTPARPGAASRARR